MCDTVHTAVLSRDQQRSASHAAQQQSQPQTHTTKSYVGECWKYRERDWKRNLLKTARGEDWERAWSKIEWIELIEWTWTAWQILKKLSELKGMVLIQNCLV